MPHGRGYVATMTFALDPRLAAASAFVGELDLCQVRLQDDARFPWLVLIPRRVGLHEIEDLTAPDRAALIEEIVRAGEVVRAVAATSGRPVQKLNVAALGNITAQLHVHVVGRRHDDGLWPDPIWGRGAAVPYGPQALQIVLSGLRLSRAG
jgi:diadenosine tetraphosphate (Ap4A) HIT family hydrolase